MALVSEQEIQATYGGEAVAAGYVDARFVAPLMGLLHERQVAAVSRLLVREQPTSTLEIAPGPGRITRHVAAPGQWTCLEYNAGMIDEARRTCRQDIRWVQGNAFEMEFDEPFDFVYTFRFVRHFDERDRRRLYDRIAAALRPGGAFLLDVVNRRVSQPLRERRPEDYPIYDKLYDSVEEIRQELSPHGLVVESAQPVLRWFGAQSKVQNLVGPRWGWLCRKLICGLEVIPSGSCLEWIVQCRRV